MKTKIYAVLSLAVLIGSAFTSVNTSLWKAKPDGYTIKFVSPKFEGIFKGLQTDIQFDETNLAASYIKASIDAKTVNTGNGMRNKHAGQGLESDKYPIIKFESISITKVGNGFEAKGKLTIKDVTKEINLPFTFSKTAEGGVFAGKFSVIPKEYHVEKSGTPELLEIELNVPVIR